MNNRVLLFEDNPINSKLITMFLEQAGYFVDLALSPEDLANKLQLNFKLALIDVTSPALNRDNLSAIVQAAKNSEYYTCPPLVAVLNNTKESEIKFYLNIGMDGYIIKPISVKTLKEVIEKVSMGDSLIVPGDDVVDIPKLSKTLGIADQDLIHELFTQFFKNVSKELKLMRSAIPSKDYETIKGLAHSIKGSARNVRLTTIGKLAEDIENQTKYPSSGLDINTLVNELVNTCKRIYNDFITRYPKK